MRTEVANGRRRVVTPLLAIAVAGLALYAFLLYSQNHRISFGFFTHPPIYGKWEPVLDPLALLVVPAAVLLMAVAWWGTAGRVRTWLALAVVVTSGVIASAAVTLVRGERSHLWRGVSPAEHQYYAADLHYVGELGIRAFAQHHAELALVFTSWNSRTHPPGALVFLYGLFEGLGPTHLLRITTAIAFVGMSAAVAAWAIGRAYGGERSGRVAAILFVAAPGPLLLAYTAMDAVYATALAGAAALFVLAIRRSSPAWAAAAGALTAVGTYLTYATVFVALAATVAIVLQAPGLRGVVRLLVPAAAAGGVVLAVERFVLGFDLLASFGAVPGDSRPYDPYWIVASPVAFLVFAGLPLAALGAVGLVRRVAGARRPVLPAVLVSIMVVWAALPSTITQLRPGEVERTWAFLYPLLAACAAPVVVRWMDDAGRWANAILCGLVGLGIAQAVLIQALWDTIF